MSEPKAEKVATGPSEADIESQRGGNAMHSEGSSPEATSSPRTSPQLCYLHVSDTKTRSDPGLPSDEDAKSARIQLMVYRKLLAPLVVPSSSSQAFDFPAFWPRVGQNPAEKLPARLVAQAELDNIGSLGIEWTLNELVRIYRDATDALHVESVNTALTVEYRSQVSEEDKSKGKEPEREAEGSATKKWIVMGTKTFDHDDEFIEDCLTSILNYWHGRREARGVEDAEVERCS